MKNMKKCRVMWNNNRSITNISDYYDKKHMKVKFNSDDGLLPKKTLEFCNMVNSC